MPPATIRTEINPRASSLSSALKSSRSPPPSLTLIDANPHLQHPISYKRSNRGCSPKRRTAGKRKNHLHRKSSAVKYQYHPTDPKHGKPNRSPDPEKEDGRTFIDWLFLRPFRCKQSSESQCHPKSVDIATIFSMAGMPSAAELLCGSIDASLELEQALASAVGIVNGRKAEHGIQKHLSEVSFKVGSGPIIRYADGDECVLPTSYGLVSGEAFNTMKKICRFQEDGDKSVNTHLFTKHKVACPIRSTLHHVELRTTGVEEELAFCLGRSQADDECRTIVRDACHRFLATNADNTFLLLIEGPPASGKSSVLREFQKTLSSSKGFHQWNIIDGNRIANCITAKSAQNLSSCVESYVKEVTSNNIGHHRERSPYVIMFDDLSLEQGLPLAQDIAKLGINTIATIGNDSRRDACSNLPGIRAKTVGDVKVMVLDISSDDQITASPRELTRSNVQSRFKLITIHNPAKERRRHR